MTAKLSFSDTVTYIFSFGIQNIFFLAKLAVILCFHAFLLSNGTQLMLRPFLYLLGTDAYEAPTQVLDTKHIYKYLPTIYTHLPTRPFFSFYT